MTAAALAVYDMLAGEVDQWLDIDATGHCVEAESLLNREARLLDQRRFDEWLDGWCSDGVLWVPLDPSSHPARDQSFYLDDLRRLRERIAWMRDATAWSQRPPLSTVRQVTNVEAFTDARDRLHVRSTLVLHEQRGAATRVWAGHQLHVFARADHHTRALHAKVLLVPELRSAVRHPGALL